MIIDGKVYIVKLFQSYTVRYILTLRKDEQLLVLADGKINIACKLNYFMDTLYAGQWNENHGFRVEKNER